MRILILGGTGEASALVRGLAGSGHAVTLSLAGRTAAPKREAVPTRVGGFGGPEGLARYLAESGIDRLVDATHPFAARISRNAAAASRLAGVPLLAIRRPAWERQAGDDWREAESVAESVACLGEAPVRALLTVGRLELAAFEAAPQHDYVVRAIEPVAEVLRVPHLTAIAARGPFDAAAESAFLRGSGIDMLVSKNSGGDATYGKIAAARELGIPVVMVRRPDKPEVPAVESAESALRVLLGTA